MDPIIPMTTQPVTEAVTEVVSQIDTEKLNVAIENFNTVIPYITGILIFFMVCLVCFGVYKFFSIFFPSRF